MIKKQYIIPIFIWLAPWLAYAQTTFKKIFESAGGVINALITTLFVLATVVFMWGIIQYLTAAGDEQKLSDAKTYIIYGIIGLFVILAMWGIARAVTRSLGA